MTRPTIKTNEWQRGPYMDRVKQCEPGPALARFFCIMATLGLAAAGLILIGDAILP